MSHAAYIFAGYGLTTAILGVYTAWVITRRKTLARTLGLDDGAAAARAGSTSRQPRPRPE